MMPPATVVSKTPPLTITACELLTLIVPPLIVPPFSSRNVPPSSVAPETRPPLETVIAPPVTIPPEATPPEATLSWPPESAASRITAPERMLTSPVAPNAILGAIRAMPSPKL